ncbi:bifunctional folylpolyglutamate synthase/dihydrofolate synthase [Nannocystaceae bacterium ST9]
MDWRESLFARRTLGVRPGFAALRRVLDELVPGACERPSFRVAQVVGTNGKGSTSAMLAHGLARAGLPGPIGLYTSPHLHRVGERVRIAGRPLADEAIQRTCARVDAVEQALGERLSFFEVLTATAIVEFVEAGCAAVVLEAGLGGRLDATTVMHADLVLIARIALDHQALLGDTLAAIAGEKAAVIRSGSPVFSQRQEPEAAAVIDAVAREREQVVRYVEPLERAPIGLIGEHQRHNAALALAGLRALLPERDDVDATWLDGVDWPGRLEPVELAAGRVWLDVAHNLDGVEALVAALREAGIRPSAIVFGTLLDKQPAAMAERLRSVAPIWLVPPDHASAMDVEALAKPGEPRFTGPDDPELRAAIERRTRAGESLLICGSHYLVGAMRGHLLALDGAALDPRELGDPLAR